MPDSAAVNAMFGRIARTYDRANRILSGGLDQGWRKRLVQAAIAVRPRRVLDLATGSGDVAFALADRLQGPFEILGMDFCAPMLVVAEQKRTRRPDLAPKIRFGQGDALSLPLTDRSFDLVTIAFGLRNLSDRARGLAEMHRVLRPGGTLLVLEFSQPAPWFCPLYFFYLRRLLPRIGGLVTGDPEAYRYLNRSIAGFPGRRALEKEILGAGFRDVSSEPLTGSTVALHQGTA